jgi:hypothetical protein
MLVVARQAGFFGVPFPATRGLTQGAIQSPTIFNIVTDAIVRHWLMLVDINGMDAREWLALFYADDGLAAARDPEWLKKAMNVLIGLFEQVGLQTNVTKTKAITCTPGHIHGPVCTNTCGKARDCPTRIGNAVAFPARCVAWTLHNPL